MELVEKSHDYLNQTVGKIVAKDYRKAMVFKSHGIDFCCGGKISVEQACLENNADLNKVLEELIAIDNQEKTSEKFDLMSLSELVDFIVDNHHVYTKNTLREMEPMVAKVAMVHGEWRPELHEIKDLFTELINELVPHMQKEEIILFPAIKAIEQGNRSPFDTDTIQHPISMMESEHDVAGDIMKQIRQLSDNYTLPRGACATYTVVYKVLEELESDLHQHIHLENNLLFPKVLQVNPGEL